MNAPWMRVQPGSLMETDIWVRATWVVTPGASPPARRCIPLRAIFRLCIYFVDAGKHLALPHWRKAGWKTRSHGAVLCVKTVTLQTVFVSSRGRFIMSAVDRMGHLATA